MLKNSRSLLLVPIMLWLLAASSARAHAQGDATATQTLRLSAFAAVSGTYTGLDGAVYTGTDPSSPYVASGSQGRNIAFTGGVDLGFQPYRFLRPSLEVRGSYPIDDGQLDSQKNVLGGLRCNVFNLARMQPYVDILFGRAEIDYAGNGYPVPGQDYTYVVSDGNVIAFGGGAEIPAEGAFALKLDFQLQRYSVPVTSSGSIYAKSLSAGLTYRFSFNRRYK